jgi:hypothetical protein
MRSGPEPWLFIVIPAIVVGLGLLFAFTRRGSVGGTTIGSRRLELHVPGDPATVFTRLLQLAGRYKVDDSDREHRIVVFSSSPTLATWGFFYPVIVHAAASGSRIEIGIQSKLIQMGPLVTRAHKEVVKAIEQLLGIPAARVA